MKKTLEILNRLVENKVIDNYAIGGAMGAMFYTEAVMTVDLDVFVLFPDNNDLLPLAPLYACLKEWGYDINELSHFCGLSYSMISALRTGKKDIGKVAAVNLLKVATYLGIRIETLISSNN